MHVDGHYPVSLHIVQDGIAGMWDTVEVKNLSGYRQSPADVETL
jgi:hypothetical protein